MVLGLGSTYFRPDHVLHRRSSILGHGMSESGADETIQGGEGGDGGGGGRRSSRNVEKGIESAKSEHEGCCAFRLDYTAIAMVMAIQKGSRWRMSIHSTLEEILPRDLC